MIDLRDHGFFHQQFDKVVEHLAKIVDSGPATARGTKTPPHVYSELLEAARTAQAEASDPVPGAYYIQRELQPTLDGDGVDVWFWGHEHDCVAYEPHLGVRAPRAIGHGAVPELAPQPPAKPPPFFKWQYDGYRASDKDRLHGAKHGFAVVDLDKDGATVQYVDDEGKVHDSPETLPPPTA